MGSTAPQQVLDLYRLQIAAVGTFQPGRPLNVSVALSSVIPTDAELHLVALDVPEDSTHARTIVKRVQATSPLTAESAASVTFAAPGYYRVSATVSLRSSVPDSLHRHEVATSVTETLWILIEAGGGRLTAGFEPRVLSGKRALFGAYGPFQVDSRARQRSRRRERVRTASASITVFGTFKYFDYSTEPVYVNAYAPVKGGRINASCIGRSSSTVIAPDVDYPVVSYVGSNGTWSVQCPTGVAYEWDYVDGNIYPDGQYADVRNHNNVSVASSFFGYDNDNLEIHAASNPQGFVLSVLEEYAPQAATRFGRSRGKVVVRVHDTDTTYTARYEYCCDYIRTHKGRTSDVLGYVTTLHEYGHAFHYVAIEPWASYEISGTTHDWFEIEQISGAFVEGFAEFFAALIGENFLVTGNLGADYNVETQVYSGVMPDSVSGWRIEGAVAGMLYDLVDSPSSPNSISNTADGVDDESANYASTSIADIMASCSLNGGSRINGLDQFIYCAEKSLAPQDLLHPTYAKYFFKLRRDSVYYSTISYASHALNAGTVRAVWLKNLFGL
ncbi:MAG: hypothetical protein U0164_19705 [Gemmatimonadaceae bacterium]